MESAVTTNLRSDEIMEMENKYGAHNYHPLPVVLSKGEGVYVWDVEGNKYFDFLSAYSAVNQGHCHPKIVNAMTEQAGRLALTSRAFYNDCLYEYEKYVTEYFGFDRVLPMNTGAEGVETALKLVRKWGYKVKGIPQNQAKIIVCQNNFHGRTITIISASNDPEATDDFGPFTPGIISIPYDDLDALSKELEDPNVCAFMVEPIQGEAGVYVPAKGYLKSAYAICKEKNVLFVADEVQTGMGRLGSLFGYQEFDLQPDVMTLAKGLGGGVPIGAFLANIRACVFEPKGEHGSTFGGNALTCAAANASVRYIIENDIAEHAKEMGEHIRSGLDALKEKYSFVVDVRGVGLLRAIEFDSDIAAAVVSYCNELGLLLNPIPPVTVRIMPPLTVSEVEIDKALKILETGFLKAYE